MPHLFNLCVIARFWVLALLVATAAGESHAETGSASPAYQRSRNVRSNGSGHGYASPQRNYTNQRQHPQHHGYAQHPSGRPYPRGQVSGSYFQRPYPYHLDYYRMRWGGSYEPYFGNLYGPPNITLGAPYYGNYNGGVLPTPYQGAPIVAP